MNTVALDEEAAKALAMGSGSIQELNLKDKPVTVTQSSEDAGGSPSRAVDGNTDGNYGGNSCTHTRNDDQAWWRVDLQQDIKVQKVAIWNRADCCGQRLSNFEIRVGRSGNWRENSKCGDKYSIRQGEKMEIDCGGLVGSIVFVVLQGKNHLTLCEVKVFGAAAETPPPAPTPVPPAPTPAATGGDLCTEPYMPTTTTPVQSNSCVLS